MTCTLCHYEFCWLCFQDHHHHKQELCNKLASEKRKKKENLVNTSKNFLNKNKLVKSKDAFEILMRERTDKFLIKLKKKKNTQDAADDFELCKEIEEFLFLTSKITFIFSNFPIDEVTIQKSKSDLINSLTRYQLKLKKDDVNKYLMIKKLKHYAKTIEKILNETRKEDLFENFL